MKHPINVAKQGMAMDQVELVSWLVEPGDPVSAGQPIAEVATDKVEITVESPTSGHFVEPLVEAGQNFTTPAVIGYVNSEAG